MSKLIAAAVVAMLWAAAATGDAAPGRTVNLNKPGALEELQRSNPAHYEKVREIMDGVLQQPETGVPRWMQTNFEARNVNYVPILMTSYPPQRRLSFALDNTRYEVVLTLTNMRPEMILLK